MTPQVRVFNLTAPTRVSYAVNVEGPSTAYADLGATMPYMPPSYAQVLWGRSQGNPTIQGNATLGAGSYRLFIQCLRGLPCTMNVQLRQEVPAGNATSPPDSRIYGFQPSDCSHPFPPQDSGPASLPTWRPPSGLPHSHLYIDISGGNGSNVSLYHRGEIEVYAEGEHNTIGVSWYTGTAISSGTGTLAVEPHCIYPYEGYFSRAGDATFDRYAEQPNIGWPAPGCEEYRSGSFTVDDVHFTTQGKVDRVAARFEQHCGSEPVVLGEIVWYAEDAT